LNEQEVEKIRNHLIEIAIICGAYLSFLLFVGSLIFMCTFDGPEIDYGSSAQAFVGHFGTAFFCAIMAVMAGFHMTLLSNSKKKEKDNMKCEKCGMTYTVRAKGIEELYCSKCRGKVRKVDK
jgi:hypothetical protein